MKHTPDDSPDKTALPKAVTMVREFLKAVNSESGKTENRFNLLQLDQALVFKPGEQVVGDSPLDVVVMRSKAFVRTSDSRKKVGR